jgi:hypothetical protein
MKRLLISSLAVMSLLSSCKKETALEFEKIDVQRHFYTALSSDSVVNGHCLVDIQLLFPVKYHNKQVLSDIQQAILTKAFDSTYVSLTALEAVDKYAETTKAALLKKTPTLYPGKAYKELNQLNTIILYNDKNILSYELDKRIEKNTDPEELTYYLVFDLRTGNRVTLKDIFIDGFEAAVTEMIVKKIITDNGFENEEDMINNGYFFSDNIVPNNNFSITEDGITFMYNPYEIATYALGQTDVTLSFAQLEPFLKKEGLLGVFLQESSDKTALLKE